MVENMREELKLLPKLIFIPPREIVRLGERWIIYLPQSYEELWQAIKGSRKKVRVYIEIID
jgi:L-lysine 2,3-aminomutase